MGRSKSAITFLAALLWTLPAGQRTACAADVCRMDSGIPPNVRHAVETRAREFFADAKRNNPTAMQGQAVPSFQSNFSAVRQAVTNHQLLLENAKLNLEHIYDLEIPANAGSDFFCGASTAAPDAVRFQMPGTGPGHYAIVIGGIAGEKPYAVTTLLEDVGGWKLAGWTLRPRTVAGHDSAWYLARARTFAAQGKKHAAWFSYIAAWDLGAPVTFMDSAPLAAIRQEADALQMSDLPGANHPASFKAPDGVTYQLIETSIVYGETGLSLALRYASTAPDDIAIRKELHDFAAGYAAQFSELKDVFQTLIVTAVDYNNRTTTMTQSLLDRAGTLDLWRMLCVHALLQGAHLRLSFYPGALDDAGKPLTGDLEAYFQSYERLTDQMTYWKTKKLKLLDVDHTVRLPDIAAITVLGD